jgi:hypothetical protein
MKRTAQSDHFNTHPQRNKGTLLRHAWLKLGILPFAAILLLASPSRASDPIGVFAKIDKVVMEPGDTAAETIQLWGSFCLADTKNRDSYLPPQKGYLYYKLSGEKDDVARKEWKDLKAIAGTGQIIGFGSRHAAKGTVRAANARPEKPDAYPLGFGLVKADSRPSSYGPIKALQGDTPKSSTESPRTRQKAFALK